jgi:hypothetical protein
VRPIRARELPSRRTEGISSKRGRVGSVGIFGIERILSRVL